MFKKFAPELTDIYTSMAPFQNFSNILGLWNFKLVKVRNQRLMKVSFWSSLKHLLQFFLMTVTMYFADYSYHDCISKDCSPLILTVIVYSRSSWYSSSLINIFCNLTFSKATADVFNRINKFDFEIKNSGIVIQHW